MPQACRVTDRQIGSVSHHAGHIIGWTGGEDPQPIYCSGHSGVSGTQTTGAGKVYIQGLRAARKGDGGTTSCPCDGGGYTITSGSGKVFIQGQSAARIGDSTNLHGHGAGSMITGAGKVFIG
jgi:uncharacterized Zn-binding protein involved in type VI secretion